MAQKRSASGKKIVKVHWLWVILAVIALAIPLTMFLSSSPQDTQSHAAEASERVAVVKKPTSCTAGVLSVQSGTKCGKKNDKRTRYVTVTCRNGAVLKLTGNTGNDARDCRTIGVWTARAQARCAERTPSCKILPTRTPSPVPTSAYDGASMTCIPSQKEFVGKSLQLSAHAVLKGRPLSDIRIKFKTKNPENYISPTSVVTNSGGVALTNYKLSDDIIAGTDTVTAYFTSSGKVMASCTYNLKFRAEPLTR